ncbi:MAG: DUF4446 family protein [Firmicutes bacterium]|nr:DUF4446 family protein [Bacillota bacterium]
MPGIIEFFSSLSPQERVFWVLLVIEGLILLLLLIAGFRLHKLMTRYRLLLAGNEGANLEEILLDLGERMKEAEERLSSGEARIDQLEKEATAYLQRWALQRYKAFANVGGDQSFSLVLLDRQGNGVMLSSIYGRDESRVYAKSITGGKANYPLSDEEQHVLSAVLEGRK